MLGNWSRVGYVVAILELGLAITAVSARAATQPVIESIEGDKIVIVRTHDGNRVATKGTPIAFGDWVKTGPQASAKIIFPDGSRLFIARDTEIQIAAPTGGVQWAELKSGEVRGVVRKSGAIGAGTPAALAASNVSVGTTAARGGKAPPPKFAIRTRSAVMGVRGTDFVFKSEEGSPKTELHTLEGAVDIAPDERTLLDGRGVRVEHGQFVDSDNGKIAVPQAFDRERYVELMRERQPEFVTLANADPEVRARQKRGSDDDIDSGSAPTASEVARPRFTWLSFQVNAVYLHQDSGGSIVSAEASWDPLVRIIGPITVRGHAGLFPLKERSANSKFLANEFGAMLGIEIGERLSIEAGLAVESWGARRGNSDGTPAAQVSWSTGPDQWLSRYFIGASNYGLSVPDTNHRKNQTLQIKAGVGIQF